MKDLKRKGKNSLGIFLHVCCPLQNSMNATKLCGEFAVTSMIQSYLEILWYVYGCSMLALLPFYVLNCRFCCRLSLLVLKLWEARLILS